jgi:hypothetical protein
MPLTPSLGDDRLLRLGGRLRRAKLPYDVLHPPILPGNNPLARALIKAFHDNMHQQILFFHKFGSTSGLRPEERR